MTEAIATIKCNIGDNDNLINMFGQEYVNYKNNGIPLELDTKTTLVEGKKLVTDSIEDYGFDADTPLRTMMCSAANLDGGEDAFLISVFDPAEVKVAEWEVIRDEPRYNWFTLPEGFGGDELD